MAEYTREEILRSLRVCATGKTCFGCIFRDMGDGSKCVPALAGAAADLLEERKNEA